MAKELEEDSAADLRSRLAHTWKSDRPSFWLIMYEELRPYCMRWLSRSFLSTNLCEEDFEDCFTDAVEGLMRRDSKEIDSPMNYVFTSARNAALDMISERKRFVSFPLELIEDGEDWDDIPEDSSAFSDVKWDAESLTEVAEISLQDEVTPKTEQLRIIFNHLLRKLPKERHWLAGLMLEHGTSAPNAIFAEIMGKTETAVKSLKSRTLADMRKLFPQSAQEVGIDLSSLLAPAVESGLESSEIPSGDGDS